MTVPLPALASRLPIGRRSTLLLDWRAADLSLTARTGQVVALVRTTPDVAVTDTGLAVCGYDAPRFSRFDTNSDGVVDTMGLLIEPATTQLALWASDLTQAAWVKTTMTATLTQTGVDGVANAASLLTATAGNATALQAITSASAQRVTSAWLRRVTGVGSVQMTQDNGATWTTVVLTATWTRFAIPNQTTANPTIGFRLVTNGDAVAVDYVQHELGAYATSAWRSVGGTVARSADSATCTSAWPFTASLTVYLKVTPLWSALAAGVGTDAYGITLGNAVPRLSVSRSGSSGVWTATIATAGVNGVQTAVAPVTQQQEVCVQFSNMLAGGTVALDVGLGLSAASSAATGFAALGSTGVYLGGFSAAGNELGGGLIVAKIARGLQTLKQMQAAR